MDQWIPPVSWLPFALLLKKGEENGTIMLQQKGRRQLQFMTIHSNNASQLSIILRENTIQKVTAHIPEGKARKKMKYRKEQNLSLKTIEKQTVFEGHKQESLLQIGEHFQSICCCSLDCKQSTYKQWVDKKSGYPSFLSLKRRLKANLYSQHLDF